MYYVSDWVYVLKHFSFSSLRQWFKKNPKPNRYWIDSEMSTMEGRELYTIPKIMLCFFAAGGCSLGEQLVLVSGRRKMKNSLRHPRVYGNIK